MATYNNNSNNNNNRISYPGTPNLIGWSSEDDLCYTAHVLDSMLIPDLSNIILHYLTYLPPKGIIVDKYQIGKFNPNTQTLAKHSGICADERYLYVLTLSTADHDENYLHMFNLHDHSYHKVSIEQTEHYIENFYERSYKEKVRNDAVNIYVHNNKFYYSNGYGEICTNDIISGKLLDTLSLFHFEEYEFIPFVFDPLEDKFYALCLGTIKVFSIQGKCIETLKCRIISDKLNLLTDLLERKIYFTNHAYVPLSTHITQVYDLKLKCECQTNAKRCNAVWKRWLFSLTNHFLKVYHLSDKCEIMSCITEIKLSSYCYPFKNESLTSICTNGIDTFFYNYNDGDSRVFRIQ